MENWTFYFWFVLGSIPDAPNGFFVSLKHFDVVHIWLPVLDVAPVVTGHHPNIVVRPNHTADRAIVSLHFGNEKVRTVYLFLTFSRVVFFFTCKIVSKLKVNPFHRVNSPLEAPVINRRPSGVHVRQNTGQRILFVATLQHKKKTKWNRLKRRIPCAVHYFSKSCRYGIAGRVQVARGRDHFWVVTYVGLKTSSVSGVSLPDSRLKSKWR